MLEAICDFVHNYFEVCTTLGSFTIADNNITGFSLLEGQRFRIKGSALNDGIYTYQHGGILDDDGIDAVMTGMSGNSKVARRGNQRATMRGV